MAQRDKNRRTTVPGALTEAAELKGHTSDPMPEGGEGVWAAATKIGPETATIPERIRAEQAARNEQNRRG